MDALSGASSELSLRASKGHSPLCQGTSIDSVPNILCLQLLRTLACSFHASQLAALDSGFVFDLQLMRRKKLSDQLAIPLQLLAR